jgi:hypothetical protein
MPAAAAAASKRGKEHDSANATLTVLYQKI